MPTPAQRADPPPRLQTGSEISGGRLAPPPALGWSPGPWLAVFGPGAILASLTIGVGELVFSTRAGSLFGYRLLWVFALVLVLKWTLVYGSARHMLLTGAHPFQRWLDLPGPRGWLPMTFFLLALPCFPIWVYFHAGTLGTLLAALTQTGAALDGAAHFAWGAAALVGTYGLATRGGYQALERIQIAIVLLMVASVLAAVFFMQPDWAAFGRGLLLPALPSYPDWINLRDHPDLATRPLWVEVITYVGVIGGSSYDYLAYTSYLRDKGWGQAGRPIVSASALSAADEPTADTLRRWLRVPRLDCTLSFLAVLVFTAVFVIGGAAVLGPQHKVPGGSNLLSLQAEFVAVLHPLFRPVYFAGALLAVFGTLYGTVEVAPTIARELLRAWHPRDAARLEPKLRRWTMRWTCGGAMLVLIWSVAFFRWRGAAQAPGLVAILTPANLFTGVLGCGLICGMNAWTDRRFLPGRFRPPGLLTFLSAAACGTLVVVGLMAGWEHSGWVAPAILAGTVLGGLAAARALRPDRP